jgi:hypothetical protein
LSALVQARSSLLSFDPQGHPWKDCKEACSAFVSLALALETLEMELLALVLESLAWLASEILALVAPESLALVLLPLSFLLLFP